MWGVPVDTATALAFVYPKCESALGQNISKVVWFIFFFLVIYLSESFTVEDDGFMNENIGYAI